MSPEQAMGEELDFKSDLFSFGILAYQMLCGAHPFGDTNNKLQLMQRIISHPPTPPGKYNPHLPAEICNLLGQLLSKNPDNRPDNTHWVANQFEQFGKLVLHTQFEHDETPALPMQSNKTNSSIEKKSIRKNSTQEHPTFDTGVNTTVNRKPLSEFFRANKVSVVLIGFSLLIATGFSVWQLRPTKHHSAQRLLFNSAR
jgi:serine/threonine-protein kinase